MTSSNTAGTTALCRVPGRTQKMVRVSASTFTGRCWKEIVWISTGGDGFYIQLFGSRTDSAPDSTVSSLKNIKKKSHLRII